MTCSWACPWRRTAMASRLRGSFLQGMHSPSAVKATSMPPFRFTILRSAVLLIGGETIEEMREMHPISGLKREASCLGMAFASGSGGTDDARVVPFE